LDTEETGTREIAQDSHFLFGSLTQFKQRSVRGFFVGRTSNGVFIAAAYLQKYKDLIIDSNGNKPTFTHTSKSVIFLLKTSGGVKKVFLVDDATNM
jgi:hypothetical protein